MVHGLRTLSPADVPPPPPGEFVPTYGYRVLTNAARLAIADNMLTVHTPDGPAIRFHRRWPFLAVNDRRCTWCRNPWPCLPATWAEDVQYQAYGWAL